MKHGDGNNHVESNPDLNKNPYPTLKKTTEENEGGGFPQFFCYMRVCAP